MRGTLREDSDGGGVHCASSRKIQAIRMPSNPIIQLMPLASLHGDKCGRHCCTARPPSIHHTAIRETIAPHAQHRLDTQKNSTRGRKKDEQREHGKLLSLQRRFLLFPHLTHSLPASSIRATLDRSCATAKKRCHFTCHSAGPSTTGHSQYLISGS